MRDTAPFVANVRRYYFYMVFKGLGFGLFTALWVIYLQEQRGLSLSQAALLDAMFFVTATLGEVPTGIVADTRGRKTSIFIGAVLMAIGIFGWTFAPVVPLIALAYIALGLGFTFTSGAEDALFYESIRLAGRESEYTRLAGRAGGTFMAALAVGSVMSGFLAQIHIVLPFALSVVSMLVMVFVVSGFTEPQTGEKPDAASRESLGQIIRQAVALLRARPSLRFPIFYLALVPLAPFMMETLFLQPQAKSFGVPIALIGVLVMSVQLINSWGAAQAERIKERIGEANVIYLAPAVFVICLTLLAAFQTPLVLVMIGAMSFVSALLRPILMNRIQGEVEDKIRATVISLQSLMFTAMGALFQPGLGFISDRAGKQVAYLVLAALVGGFTLVLFRVGRAHFPRGNPTQAAIETPVSGAA